MSSYKFQVLDPLEYETNIPLSPPMPFRGSGLKFWDIYLEEIMNFLQAEYDQHTANWKYWETQTNNLGWFQRPVFNVYFNDNTPTKAKVATGTINYNTSTDTVSSVNNYYLPYESTAKVVDFDATKSTVARLSNTNPQNIVSYLADINQVIEQVLRPCTYLKPTGAVPITNKYFDRAEVLVTSTKNNGIFDKELENLRLLISKPCYVKTTDGNILFIDALAAKQNTIADERSFLGKFSILKSDGTTFTPKYTIGSAITTSRYLFPYNDSTYCFIDANLNFLITDKYLRSILEGTIPYSFSEFVGFNINIGSEHTTSFTYLRGGLPYVYTTDGPITPASETLTVHPLNSAPFTSVRNYGDAFVAAQTYFFPLINAFNASALLTRQFTSDSFYVNSTITGFNVDFIDGADVNGGDYHDYLAGCYNGSQVKLTYEPFNLLTVDGNFVRFQTINIPNITLSIPSNKTYKYDLHNVSIAKRFIIAPDNVWQWSGAGVTTNTTSSIGSIPVNPPMKGDGIVYIDGVRYVTFTDPKGSPFVAFSGNKADNVGGVSYFGCNFKRLITFKHKEYDPTDLELTFLDRPGIRNQAIAPSNQFSTRAFVNVPYNTIFPKLNEFSFVHNYIKYPLAVINETYRETDTETLYQVYSYPAAFGLANQNKEVMIIGDPFKSQADFDNRFTNPKTYTKVFYCNGIPDIKWSIEPTSHIAVNPPTTPATYYPQLKVLTPNTVQLTVANEHNPLLLSAKDSYQYIFDPKDFVLNTDDNSITKFKPRTNTVRVKVWPRTLPRALSLKGTTITIPPALFGANTSTLPAYTTDKAGNHVYRVDDLNYIPYQNWVAINILNFPNNTDRNITFDNTILSVEGTPDGKPLAAPLYNFGPSVTPFVNTVLDGYGSGAKPNSESIKLFGLNSGSTTLTITQNGMTQAINIEVWDVGNLPNSLTAPKTPGTLGQTVALNIVGNSSYPHYWSVSDPTVAQIVYDPAYNGDSRRVLLSAKAKGTFRLTVVDSALMPFCSLPITIN